VNTSDLTLDEILQVEDDESLLDFACDESGDLLWPIIRIQFIRFILSDLLYGTPLVATEKHHPYGHALVTLIKGSMRNVYHRREAKSPIMLMGTGVGNFLLDNRWFNRLTDHFVFVHPTRTCTVEDFFEWRWPFPRHNPNVFFHAPIQVCSTMAGRLRVRSRHLAQATRLVNLVRGRAKKILDWDLGNERGAYLMIALARHAAAIPYKREAYHALLTRVGVKLLIKEEACYGPSGVLIAVAKEAGIVTAEYQHGAISAGNDAYNFAPTLVKSMAYRRSLPEYFLGYGKWWNDQINAPVRTISLGNPHRLERLQNLQVAQSSAKDDVLLLGDGIETQFYLDFALGLAKRLGKRFRIVFRPHPLERQWVKHHFRSLEACMVHVDDKQDIYESFLTAHAVVSEVSTGLFEAVGLADRIFVWNTPKSRFCYPQHPFESVQSEDDLADQLVSQVSYTSTAVSAQDIWATDWRKNYLEFLHELRLDGCIAAKE
jgi:hypothetical protein